nr:hypothetical protein [Tanacetum cinerariifolium]
VGDEDVYKELGDKMERAATTASSLEAEHDSEETTPMPHDSPLQSTKKVYSSTLTKLILREKKSERIVKTSRARRKSRIVISEDEDAEDPSKQKRSLIEELDMDIDIFCATKVLADAAEQGRSVGNVHTYTRQRRRVNTASTLVSTADVSTASEMVRIAGLKARNKELARFNAKQEAIDIARKEKVIAEGDQAHDINWSDPATGCDGSTQTGRRKNQHEYNLISWRLCDSSRIHILLMDNGIAIHMLIEKKYPLGQEMISKMLNKRLEVKQES